MGCGGMKKKPEHVETRESGLRPDGWQRFEKAVDIAVKGGPKHASKVNPYAADFSDPTWKALLRPQTPDAEDQPSHR